MLISILKLMKLSLMSNLVKLTLISFLLIYSGCISDCIKHYVFEVPLEVTPWGSTLHVGDTLHVLMLSDNQIIYDTIGRRIVQFPDFDPNAIFKLPLIDTYPVKEGFLLNKVIVDTNIYDAKLLNTEHLGLGLFFFGIPKNKYESKIEFKVVLNTPGQYMLSCTDAMFVNESKIVFPDKCGNDGNLEVYFNIFQGDHIDMLSDNHFEVLDKFWKNSSGDKYGSDNYYFRVLE